MAIEKYEEAKVKGLRLWGTRASRWKGATANLYQESGSLASRIRLNPTTHWCIHLSLLLPRMNASFFFFFFFFVKHFEFVFFLFLFWWRLLGILLGCSSFLFTNTGYLFFLFLFPLDENEDFQSGRLRYVMAIYTERHTHIRNKCLAFVFFKRLDTLHMASTIKPEKRITSCRFFISVFVNGQTKWSQFSSIPTGSPNGLGQSLTISILPVTSGRLPIVGLGWCKRATGPCAVSIFSVVDNLLCKENSVCVCLAGDGTISGHMRRPLNETGRAI